ncbi:MAG: glycosyltransferase [Bacteroidales bacterium]|nr:glycosyltransferase [Bacteroidales bacterium]
MNKILSIIIPTYNMSKYLSKCLDSMIVDGMNCLEVLVINDGSTDNSSEIGHTYQEKYPETFRIIDKVNGNYGSCVNRGLSEARGKYIKVVDADDFLDKHSLEKLLVYLQDIDADLILSDFNKVYEDGREEPEDGLPFPVAKLMDSNKLFENRIVCMGMKMHRIIYKLENIKQLQYKQMEGVSYTDQQWMFIPMSKVNTFVYLDIPLYKYLYDREGQTMSISFYKKAMPQYMAVILSLIDIYNATVKDLNNSHKNYYEFRIESQLGVIYRNYLANGYHLDLKELKKFDLELQSKNMFFYQMMNQQTILRGYKFIKMWRRFDYKNDYGIITFLFRLTHKNMRR